MLRRLPLLLLLLIPNLVRAEAPDLKALYDSRSFFQLRDSIEEKDAAGATDYLFYKGAVENKFNRLRDSIENLKAYTSSPSANNDLKYEAFSLIADAYRKLGNYRGAAETYRQTLTTMSSTISGRERRDLENAAAMWDAFKDVPPQTVDKDGITHLENRSKGGIEVQVSLGSTKLPLQFDTGANVSVMSESLASKVGMKVLNTTARVGSITGRSITANLGYLPELKIGNVTVHNPIFLLLKDEDLTPAPGFHIDGLIGYPIISALGEISVTRLGLLTIPSSPSDFSAQNLCIDNLTPLVDATCKGKRVTFSFDTGANTTNLYPPFIRAFSNEIASSSEKVVEVVNGIGSRREIPSYLLHGFSLTVAGKEVSLEGMRALTQFTLPSSRSLYGNLGFDVLNQFPKVTISFARMAVAFG